MRVEFVRASPARQLRALLAFDRKIFSASDRFPASYWRKIESFWMLLDGERVGCCAFERDVDFKEDLRDDGLNPRRSRSLYIATTGILPKYQNLGLGQLFKSWQVAYAKRNGFERVLTNSRASNKRMIAINRRLGFRVIRRTPGYYTDPEEGTVVMELELAKRASRR